MLRFESDQVAQLNEAALRREAEAASARLERRYGPRLPHPRPALEEMLVRCFTRMRGYGLGETLFLEVTGAWEAFYGPSFEARDPDGALLAILRSDSDAFSKFADLAARMRALGPRFASG